jgi:tripartite ATP-independent transporter DctP family solute receptor
MAGIAFAEPITLRYAHMNTVDSIAGKQAQMFADSVYAKTGGKVKIEVFPNSKLGGLKEMVEQVSLGTIAIHHNTMAGIGNIYSGFAALDTPYLYKDANHLMRVINPSSPVMQKLNGYMIKEKGVRVLYSFYFGTRELTCNKAVYSPSDLKGLKIRAIPFPIYQASVEGLGAIAAPVDISELKTALTSGAVAGQENPVDVILSMKFYEMQKYLVMTNHIIAGECVVVNEGIWQKIPADLRAKIQEAASETSAKATKMTMDLEDSQRKALKDKGMTIIDAKSGLKISEFESNTKKVLKAKIGARYDDIYKQIQGVK